MEFLENRRSCENQKPPRKLPEKWTFLSLAFYNAPSLDTVNQNISGYSENKDRKSEEIEKNRDIGTNRGDTPFLSRIRNRPNTVSESTVSNTELSEFFGPHRVPGENSLSSSQPIICVPKRTHRVFFRKAHRVCRRTR